jgi:hypothetical protein
MKFKLLSVVFLFISVAFSHANCVVYLQDTTTLNPSQLIDTDSLLNRVSPKNNSVQQSDTSKFTLPTHLTPVKIDTLILQGNPFFIDLVFMGYAHKFHWENKPDFQLLWFGKPATTVITNCYKPFKIPEVVQIIDSLRMMARDEISRKAANLYILTYDELPDPNANKSHLIENERLENVQFVDENGPFRNRIRKIYVKKEVLGPWTHKAAGLAQFSENTVTSNWYQGGNNNVAVLGIASGNLNYDDKKYIQWENNAEWHLGFNTLPGDTLHMLGTNDDILKINSKLGIKAAGNFFYSGSLDFSTQFFNSYKGINSTVLKTSFLTPVRLNIGAGIDFKYKKIFSLMFSPIAYKYIYVNDTVHVDPNLFGIQRGKNVLSEIGSSFTALVSYPVTHEIQLDSKLSFYTNYQKVQVDWEIVCNMVINRFMSTRISINPRYDNTAIMPNGDKAQIQFKQLVSVGFSHRFL